MDRELRAFFGRAKNISLLPQERGELKGAIVAERKAAPVRHTSRMQQVNPALMSTASTISLSAREKRKTHRELKSFMRAHPVRKAERVFSPWSFPRMIPLYAPLLVVTLIILANTQQWGEKALVPQAVEESLSEEEDAVSVPIFPFFVKLQHEGGDQEPAVLQDDAVQQERRKMVSSPPPQGGVRQEAEPQEEREVPLQQDTDGLTAPAKREKPAEGQAAGGEGAPESTQMRTLQNKEPAEADTVPAAGSTEMRFQPAVQQSQTQSKSGSAFMGILTVAEARLESLRQKSLESEGATVLFRQAEQKLSEARASAEQDEGLALQYLQDAETLMDELEALGST